MLWKANEVRDFLKSKGLIYFHNKGDDEYWKNEKLPAVIKVPQRNEDIIKPTLQWMIQRSKIPKREWVEWKSRQ